MPKVKGIEILGNGKPFKKEPYLDTAQLRENPNLQVDDSSYISNKYCPNNYKQDALKQKYSSKKQYLQSFSMDQVFASFGSNKNIYESIAINQLKLPWPVNYSLQFTRKEQNQKKAHISRLDDAYRIGGNINFKKCTFYIFWVDLKKCDIYDH